MLGRVAKELGGYLKSLHNRERFGATPHVSIRKFPPTFPPGISAANLNCELGVAPFPRIAVANARFRLGSPSKHIRNLVVTVIGGQT